MLLQAITLAAALSSAPAEPPSAAAPPSDPAPAASPARTLAPLGFPRDPDPDLRAWEPRPLKLTPAELLELPVEPRERTWLLPVGEKALADAITWSVAWAWGEEWTHISLESMERNLTGKWTFDPNDFATNQFGHPYHGHLAFSGARAAGYSFWEALPFPIVLSTLWEIFAETEPPSINDAITTPIGGTFLGEALFRLHNMVLDSGGLRPGAARLWAAGLVSPTAGLNRALTGNRYRHRLEEPIPAVIEGRLGGSFSGSAYSQGTRWATGGLVSGSVQVTYGIPVGDWSFRRPFDHFDFYGSLVASSEPWMVLQVRGLMLGDDVGEGLARGLWGLWGIYDMTTLQPFRVSTSALGFGATGQFALPSGLALQGTALLGFGFGAAGSREASELTPDYHYGLGGLALLDARLIAADRGALRLALRQYGVGGLVSPESEGHETVAYHTFGATLRVVGPHAVGLEVTRGRRWAGFPGRPDTFESFAQAVAYYAYVSDKTMGSGLRAAVVR